MGKLPSTKPGGMMLKAEFAEAEFGCKWQTITSRMKLNKQIEAELKAVKYRKTNKYLTPVEQQIILKHLG